MGLFDGSNSKRMLTLPLRPRKFIRAHHPSSFGNSYKLIQTSFFKRGEKCSRQKLYVKEPPPQFSLFLYARYDELLSAAPILCQPCSNQVNTKCISTAAISSDKAKQSRLSLPLLSTLTEHTTSTVHAQTSLAFIFVRINL